MRIATYNLWNCETGMPERTDGILSQIKSVDADILCLQEVKSKEYYESLLQKSDYPYSCFFNHAYESEGLAILSKHPIKVQHYILKAVFALIEYNGTRIAQVNLHLDGESILKREKEIIETIKYLQYMNADHIFLAGDFNCSPESGVHRFLLGQQSLNNTEASPRWFDLAEAYADLTGTAPEATLDFRKNPRWNGENTIEVNQRTDRILMMSPYPKEFPKLLCCNTFGQKAIEGSAYAPSDHWGVYADLEL